ncbi:MAG: gliding motility-associated ABC transporter ATP-binding subunit GldA [Bacteroidota bacterium]
MSIRVNDLIKTFGTQNAVDTLSFEVKDGEIVGFLGPNGAGKSTTMKVITCFLPPTSGVVEVNGHDVVKNPEQVKKILGYLPEHNPLYLDMFVREYLNFIGKVHGMQGSRLKTRINEIVSLCGLTKEQNKKVEALSKGYRQRVGLAQALIHDPKVLILDEPTTGLDPNQIIEIRNLIKSLARNKTVLFSSHIMQEVQALCDRVIVINDGKLVASDTIKTLSADENKRAIIRAEFSNQPDKHELLKIEGVKRVDDLGDGVYRLEVDAHIDARPSIFKFAAEKNAMLLGLRQEEASMETVFQELTKPDKD